MTETVRDRAAAAAAARREQTEQPGTDVATKARPDPARAMVAEIGPELERQLPRHIRPEAFMRVILTGLKNSKQAKQLAQCSRPSLYAAMLEAARFGLMPFTDEGAIVPFRDGRNGGYNATFIPQYQGFVQMFYRTGQISAVTANLIYQRDEWGIGYGDGGGFYHRPQFVDGDGNSVDRGKPIMAYCYLTRTDGTRTEVTFVTREQAEETRDNYSRSYQNAERSWDGRPAKKDSTWHTDFPGMWLKTAVRRHAKWAPKSPELVELLMVEARDDLRRSDATPVPMRPSQVTDRAEGDDWTHDVNGTVTGEVIPGGDETGWPDDSDESWPGGAVSGEAAGPGEGHGSADSPPASTQPAEPPADPAGPMTTATTKALNDVFGQSGLGGRPNVGRRQEIAGILAAAELGMDGPITVTRWDELTEAQGQAAITRLTRFTNATPDINDRRKGLRDLLTAAHKAADAQNGGQPQ